MRDAAIEKPLRELREIARAERPTALNDARRWIEVIAATDIVDGAERDPLDLELGLENLMRVAAQYDDEEADARSARFANALSTSFQETRKVALGTGRVRQRAAAINALEGIARAFALRLWAPLLATRPAADPIEQPSLDETWNLLAAAPNEILDLVKERRAAEDFVDMDDELPLEVLAIRLGAYALDACGEDSELGPGRGPTAHATCFWLRKVEGLADGSRDMPARAGGRAQRRCSGASSTRRAARRSARSTTFEWLGPFAAWWALVIDRPAMLLQLGTALPMMSQVGARDVLRASRHAPRRSVSSGPEAGAWGPAAIEAMSALNAQDDGARQRAARAREGARVVRRCSRRQADARAALYRARPRRPIACKPRSRIP